MTRSELGCILLASVAALLCLLSLAQHDERRSDGLFIDAQVRPGCPTPPPAVRPMPIPIQPSDRARIV